MIANATLVRYGELAIKGLNRPQYERALIRNLRHALESREKVSIENLRGRLLVRHACPFAELVQRISKVCGVKSFSPVHPVQSEYGPIETLVLSLFDEAWAQTGGSPSFRIRTRRADKTFPIPSLVMDQRIGASFIARFPGCAVRLDDPEVEIGIEIRPEGSFVFMERFPGPGGLPVGMSGRGLALLSGGIDSPVAAFLAMKRGMEVGFCYFHSPEFIGEGPLGKVRRLVKLLSAFQPRNVLQVVPFTQVQLAIQRECQESYRTILYRRMMHRIAAVLATSQGRSALITGDSLGQVASQTLENLDLTARASPLPVLRPLITFDKEETIALARTIGTFETSIIDEPDCCTLFQPRRPKTHGRLEEVVNNESKLDIDALVSSSVQAVQAFSVT